MSQKFCIRFWQFNVQPKLDKRFQNPNIEIRNPKQYQNSNVQNSKQKQSSFAVLCFGH